MERITVNMSPTAMLETCHASQFDVGVQKRFDLVDGSSAYTLTGAETITLKIRTPDGTLVESNVPNTSDSYVIWTSGEGELDAFGICLCSIHVTNGSDELGSGNFIMEVEADPYDGKNVRTVTVGPADICTFETTLPEPLQSVIVDIEATGGNGTPDSPIPINGYTEANITMCGVNLWDEEIEEGRLNPFDGTEVIANDYYRSKNFIPCKSGVSYYAVTINNPPTFVIVFYDKNQDYLGYLPTASVRNTVFSIPDGASFLKLYYTKGDYSISINYPATDTTYHAYTGNTYTVNFGQTVYGGVLDVTRGKLHVKWSNAVDLGLLGWAYDVAQQVFVTTDFVGYKNGTPFLCDVYTDLGAVAISQITNCGGTLRGVAFYIKNTDYTDAPTFKTAMSGKYITAELAAPFDIDLTPEVISSVVGTNNVFADCGETEVKYLKAEG